MSEDSKSLAGNTEFRVLKAMKSVLTDVIKDTTTTPGLKHPLSDTTIENIRQCLLLITSREAELMEEAGHDNAMRPHYTDEPQSSVVIPIDSITSKKNKE